MCTDLKWQGRAGWGVGGEKEKHSHARTHPHTFIHSFQIIQVEYDLCHHICIWYDKSCMCYFSSFIRTVVCARVWGFFILKCTCIYTVLLLFIIIFEHNTILLTPSSFTHSLPFAFALARSLTLSLPFLFLFSRVIIPMKFNPPIFSFIRSLINGM